MTKDVLLTVLAALFVVALAVIGIFASTSRRTFRVIAVVVGVIALVLTFGLAYNDAEFKRGLREDVADAKRTSQRVLDAMSSNPTAERRLLKSLALDWADRAETFLKGMESKKASVALHIATATQANFSGVLHSDLARCESMRADAKSLRDKILARIPEARDASETTSYTAKECVAALPSVIKDLKGTALRLPDS
jgi:hypothetical protein